MAVRRSKDILFSQLDEELLAIDSQAGFCYSLNETAGHVWDQIAVTTPIATVCAHLQQAYAVDPPTCRREVLALLEGLNAAGLLEVFDVAAP